MRSLWSEEVAQRDRQAVPRPQSPTAHGGILLPSRYDDHRWLGSLKILPLRPIWPGFAVNTLFYAALLLPPVRGPFALRRTIRRYRGRCLKCGYDLRGGLDAGCPECGWNREDEG